MICDLRPTSVPPPASSTSVEVYLEVTRNQARDQTRVSKEPAGLDFEPAGLELEPVGLELEPVGLEFGPKLA